MADSDIERLRDAIAHAWDEARNFGLDPFPTHFELVPATIMYEFASYSLPGRFSHWTHGKAYHRQKMQYDFGLSKIYELVVNTNPSYAFLMDMNDLLQNTFVAAHVFGHTNFFKNNAYFQHTSRRMIDKVSVHAERIAKYEYDHGKAEVERFLDAVLSIQEHVDYNLLIRENEPEKKDEKGFGLYVEGDLCPHCRYMIDTHYRGHIEDIPVKRIAFSEKYRVGHTLSQEQNIKTGRFSMIYADEVVISHTDEYEYQAFVGNKKSESLQDRIILVKVCEQSDRSLTGFIGRYKFDPLSLWM